MRKESDTGEIRVNLPLAPDWVGRAQAVAMQGKKRLEGHCRLSGADVRDTIQRALPPIGKSGKQIGDTGELLTNNKPSARRAKPPLTPKAL